MRATKPEAVLSFAAGAALALSILLLTFQVLLAPPLTRLYADRFVNDAASPATHEQLVDAACATLAYCTGDDDAPIPYGTDDSVAYTPEVMGHLDDVRGFFSGMGVAAFLAALVLVVSVLLLALLTRRRGAQAAFRRMLSRVLLVAPCLVLAVIAAAGIFALVDFNALFNLLHSFFFSSGSWLFPYDSLLICALPEDFWAMMGLTWLLMVVAASAVLILASVILRRRSSVRGDASRKV